MNSTMLLRCVRSSSVHRWATSAAQDPNTFVAAWMYMATMSDDSIEISDCRRYGRSFCGSESSLYHPGLGSQKYSGTNKTYLLYSPHTQAAAQRISEQLPSSRAFRNMVVSLSKVYMSLTAYLLTPRTRPTTSTSWSRISAPTSTFAMCARSTRTEVYHSKFVTLSYVDCAHMLRMRWQRTSL